MIWTLILLVTWHCLADYPLQGDFLAKAKNRTAPIPGVPWYWALAAHAAIHAGGAALITGVAWVFVFEFLLHFVIDDAKCRGGLSFDQDQWLHLLCKAFYVTVLYAFGLL